MRAERRGEKTARLFTQGHLFMAPAAGDTLPKEPVCLGALLLGPRPTYLSKPGDHDALDAKSIAEELVLRATGHTPTIRQLTGAACPPHLHPRASAEVRVGEVVCGTFGLLHPDVADRWDGHAFAVVELSVDALAAIGRKTPRVVPLPDMPAIKRDLAVVVHDDQTAAAVSCVVRDVAGELCEGVELFDVFTGGSVPPDHRSLAFRIVYRVPGRTLTDKEVDERHAAVVSEVKTRLGGELRA